MPTVQMRKLRYRGAGALPRSYGWEWQAGPQLLPTPACLLVEWSLWVQPECFLGPLLSASGTMKAASCLATPCLAGGYAPGPRPIPIHPLKLFRNL